MDLKTIPKEQKNIITKIMRETMYKSNIGDYPLKTIPCEYWFVRYGVGCKYFTDSFEKIWEKKMTELKKLYKFESFAFQGYFGKSLDGLSIKKEIKVLQERRIILYVKSKKKSEKQMQINLTGKDHKGKYEKLWDVLLLYIEDRDKVHWHDCPYQNDNQRKCPLYKKSDWYKGRKLKELRTHKGYYNDEC